jgi:1-acyl-sn-glycerol-3-phosphate acyltransferase
MSVVFKKISFYLILFTFSSLCVSIQILSSLIISRLGTIGKITNYYTQLYIKKSFVSISVTLLSLFTSTNIRIVGKESDIEKLYQNQQVVISNHLIYTDWIYIWIMYWHINKSEIVNMFLANRFKYIPILGIGMYFMNFIFLKRDWSKDYKIMKKVRNVNFQLFNFI